MFRVLYIVLICVLSLQQTSRDWGSSRRELGAHGSRDGEGLGEAMLSTNEGLKLLQIKVESNSARRES